MEYSAWLETSEPCSFIPDSMRDWLRLKNAQDLASQKEMKAWYQRRLESAHRELVKSFRLESLKAQQVPERLLKRETFLQFALRSIKAGT